MSYTQIKMDTIPTVYGYSSLPTKGSRNRSLCSRLQSVFRSPVVILVLIVAGGFLCYLGGVYSVHCHGDDSLKRSHRVNISDANSNELENGKQDLPLCLQTIRAMNDSVGQMRQSTQVIHQLEDDIQKNIVVKNESLIPHLRRRPPVETWNTTTS